MKASRPYSEDEMYKILLIVNLYQDNRTYGDDFWRAAVDQYGKEFFCGRSYSGLRSKWDKVKSTKPEKNKKLLKECEKRIGIDVVQKIKNEVLKKGKIKDPDSLKFADPHEEDDKKENSGDWIEEKEKDEGDCERESEEFRQYEYMLPKSSISTRSKEIKKHRKKDKLPKSKTHSKSFTNSNRSHKSHLKERRKIEKEKLCHKIANLRKMKKKITSIIKKSLLLSEKKETAPDSSIVKGWTELEDIALLENENTAVYKYVLGSKGANAVQERKREIGLIK